MLHDPDLELRKFLAPEIVFGPGARHLAGRYIQNLGVRKVLLVSDKGVASAGWTGEIADRLRRDDIEIEIFLDVTPNPKDYEAVAGAELFRSTGCEGLIAVGGGSPMDLAKVVGILAANPGQPNAFVGIDQIPEPGPPLVCIPTTAGSSADVSQFAILTDTKNRTKAAYVSKVLVSDAALIDPETTWTKGPELTAATALDALTHAFESFVSTAHSPITDIHAVEAVRLIFAYLLPCLKNLKDPLPRSRLMRASMEAGLAFSNTSLGAIHAMAHSMGGFIDAPHGECNAALLRTVVEFNWKDAGDRYRELAERAGLAVDTGAPLESLLGHLTRLIEETNIEKNLVFNLTSQDVRQMASRALVDPCLVTNPRPCTLQNLEALYEKALTDQV